MTTLHMVVSPMLGRARRFTTGICADRFFSILLIFMVNPLLIWYPFPKVFSYVTPSFQYVCLGY